MSLRYYKYEPDDIQLILDYHKDWYENNISQESRPYYDLNDDEENPEFANPSCDHLYYYMVELRGYSEFPKVIESETYAEIQNDDNGQSIRGNEYEHGFKRFNHAAGYLTDHYYHYGEGGYGSGFYLTNNHIEALTYAGIKRKSNDKRKVLPVKILSNNGIDWKYLRFLANAIESGDANAYKRLLKEIIKENPDYIRDEEHLKLEKQRCEMFHDLVRALKKVRRTDFGQDIIFRMSTDYSIVGAFLGFDYAVRNIHKDEWNDIHHVIVFNRGCIGVDEKKYEEIMNRAGGKYSKSVDFDKNTEK